MRRQAQKPSRDDDLDDDDYDYQSDHSYASRGKDEFSRRPSHESNASYHHARIIGDELEGAPNIGMDNESDDDTNGTLDDEEEDEDEGYHAPIMHTDASKNIFEMSVTHSKILILISKYARAATSADEEQTWIRELPLTVMMYEGIAAGVIDCDYAPKSTIISFEGVCCRKFMNISQEAQTIVETLVEEKLVVGLRLSSSDFRPTNAYQVSVKGLQFLHSLPTSLFQEIDTFVYAPHAPCVDSELLHVVFNGEGFLVRTQSGYTRDSSVTDIEDVSYVVSPFLPGTLLTAWAKSLRSNAHRAHEAAVGMANVRDQKFKEAVRLARVHVLVGEWVPFGANGVVAINEKLGCLDRCQGGLFTSLVDKTPLDMSFKMRPGLTSVKVIDFDMVRFANLEVEVIFPEEQGIVQIEVFGLHVNMDGTVYQGTRIEAIMNRLGEDVAIDFLSRVLVDVQLDSSKLLDDLLSAYQRQLLDTMYLKDALNRSKFNLILASGIHPKLPANSYIDRGWFENELKQVLGPIILSEDIGADDIIILGKDGLLLAGPSIAVLEPYVLHYATLHCREIFVSNLFLRTFVLKDSIEKVHQLILQQHTDPNNLNRIQTALSEAAADIFQLHEVLEYLEESLMDTVKPREAQDGICKRITEVLDSHGLQHNIMARVEDMRKLLQGSSSILRNLMNDTSVITTTQLEDVFNNVDANFKYLVDASAAGQRSSAALGVMQIVLAGSFCLLTIDRSTGGTYNFFPPNWSYVYLFQPIIETPGMFFLFNMAWLAACSYGLIRLMRYLELVASGTLTLRVRVNKKLAARDGLEAFFSDKSVDEVEMAIWVENATVKTVEWKEDDEFEAKWLGSAPFVEFTFDSDNMFCLGVAFTVDKKVSTATEEDLVNILLQDLVLAGAMEREEAFGPESTDDDLARANQAANIQGGDQGEEKTIWNLFGLLG